MTDERSEERAKLAISGDQLEELIERTKNVTQMPHYTPGRQIHRCLIELADIRPKLAANAATIAAQAAEIERLTRDLSDAAMLIRRLAYRCPGLAVAHQATDWLKRKGLQGSILRETEDSNG